MASKMSNEIANCCGTTCDKAAVMAEIERLRADNAGLSARVEALQADAHRLIAENAAVAHYTDGLKCMVERYSCAVSRQARKEAWNDDHPLVQVSTMTPTQCLRQIQAESGRVGYLEALQSYSGATTANEDVELANQYAERVAKAGTL